MVHGCEQTSPPANLATSLNMVIVRNLAYVHALVSCVSV